MFSTLIVDIFPKTNGAGAASNKHYKVYIVRCNGSYSRYLATNGEGIEVEKGRLMAKSIPEGASAVRD